MDDHPSRRSCRLVLVAIAALVALAVVPAAGAHARLITTEPANDAVLEQSPAFVLLRFDEPVETAFGAIRVYDAQARRVDAGRSSGRARRRPGSGSTGGLARGTYTVTWRVVSADGAPDLGRVRLPRRRARCEPGGRSPPQVLESGTPASVAVLFSVVRALDFLLLLLVGGGTLMLVIGLGGASSETRSRLSRLLARPAAACSLVVALARDRAPGRGRRAASGSARRFSWDVVSAVLGTRFGRSGSPRRRSPLTCAVAAASRSRRDRRRSRCFRQRCCC